MSLRHVRSPQPPTQPLTNTPLVNNLDLTVALAGTTSIGNGQIGTTNTVEQAPCLDST
jgi:hypothetical protein